jgi:hypothetical protein
MLSTTNDTLPVGVAARYQAARQTAIIAGWADRSSRYDRAVKIIWKFIMGCDHNSQRYFVIEQMKRMLNDGASLSEVHAYVKSRRALWVRDMASI